MQNEIDRISPTLRPDGPVRGYQLWRDLLFMHWPVPIDALRAVVPRALELDLWQGTAYVGVVPFAMFDVRPRWAPRAVAFNFLETNVRTYVHVQKRDPGVYFLSLDAASRIAVAAARIGWGLPYFHARMKLSRSENELSYELRRLSGGKPRLSVRYRTGKPLGPSAPGTLEHFLVERYFLHLERGGHLLSGRVHHEPYPVQQAEVLECNEELIAAADLPQTSGLPPLVHYAAGVDVEIFDLLRRADS